MEYSRHTGMWWSAPVAAHRHAAMVRYHDTVYSGTFACTCYRTEVPYVGNAVKHYDKRLHAGFIKLRHQVVKPVISDRRQYGHHSLMVLARYLVDFLYRNTLAVDMVTFNQREQFCRKFAVQLLAYHHLVYLLAGFNRLDDGTYAIYVVRSFHLFLYFKIQSSTFKIPDHSFRCLACRLVVGVA
jgi:hypothetical protein